MGSTSFSVRNSNYGPGTRWYPNARALGSTGTGTPSGSSRTTDTDRKGPRRFLFIDGWAVTLRGGPGRGCCDFLRPSDHLVDDPTWIQPS